MYKIMIDPGHGGSDTGAVNATTTEKEVNLEVCYILKDFLESNKKFKVAMTRFQDTEISLEGRCSVANSWGADIFVSVHHNAYNGTVDGYEIYHYTGSSNGSKLADYISNEFSNSKNSRYVGSGLYSGNKKGNYYVLENTKMVAVLTEYCFMDHKNFLTFNPKTEAEAIYKGICDFYGIDHKIETKEINWKENGIIQLHQAGVLQDKEGWIKKLDEPMPTWAVTTLLNEMYKKLKK